MVLQSHLMNGCLEGLMNYYIEQHTKRTMSNSQYFYIEISIVSSNTLPYMQTNKETLTMIFPIVWRKHKKCLFDML